MGSKESFGLSKSPQSANSHRPTIYQYAYSLCEATAHRSTCLHRHQGAIIMKDRHVISTGYNGSAPGAAHCNDLGYCSKDKGLPCKAEGLHGESNAILAAAKHGIATKDTVLYCIYAPCRSCCNIISVSGIRVVVYFEPYPGFPDSFSYLTDLGISCCHVNRDNTTIWSNNVEECI